MEQLKTKKREERAPYAATTNACKLCKPMGAAIAFKGIEGCVSFLHGSQGCATYMRRYIISHFNEPIDIASSSLGEKHAIHGGGPNLKLGLKNVTEKYQPKVIGIATTCLTETIGDNVPMYLREYMAEFGSPDSPKIVHCSTPSYSGTHMEGFHAAVKAVVEQLTEPCEPVDSVNILCGFASTADIRWFYDVFEYYDQHVTVLPDYSDSLDGPALDDYPLVPEGGTPLESIRTMGGARATFEFGGTLRKDSAGNSLHKMYGTPLYQLGLPIGIRATDAFLKTLSEVTDKDTPHRYIKARGRLIDAMVDGHKYIFGKRAVIYGEEDLVAGIAGLLAEIGVRPVICASGGKSGHFAEAVEAAMGDLCPELPEVLEDVDFLDIEELATEIGVDLIIGHSKGYTFARREGIPLIRVGFPIHDRMGGQRLLHLGYEGAQRLFDEIVNIMIAKKQDDNPIGYTYM